jgi:hypothetical protein
MSSQKQVLNADSITEWYMQDYLGEGGRPKNVFLFAKHHDFKESDFYQFFGSFDGLESKIFQTFFKKTMLLLQEDKNWSSYDSQAKLLGFYFTFFEMMTANRSFVTLVLGQGVSDAFAWRPMLNIKEDFTSFIAELELKQVDLPIESLKNLQDKAAAELLWHHFLCIVNFWLNDESPQFEKTDTFIEKSVITGFELMNTTPLEKLFDLGKFMMREAPKNTKMNPMSNASSWASNFMTNWKSGKSNGNH